MLNAFVGQQQRDLEKLRIRQHKETTLQWDWKCSSTKCNARKTWGHKLYLCNFHTSSTHELCWSSPAKARKSSLASDRDVWDRAMCCLQVGNQNVAWWRHNHLSEGHLRQLPRRGGCHLSRLTGSLLEAELTELPGSSPTDIFTVLSRRTKALYARREEQLIEWSMCMSFMPVSYAKTSLCLC